MTSGGVPAGAAKTYHAVASKPGKPASSAVGTSGNCSERLLLVTARPRSWPAFDHRHIAGNQSDADIDLRADEIADRRRPTIRHRGHRGAAEIQQGLERNVGGGTGPRDAGIHFAGIG